jgi:hypothetical protein
MSDCTETIIGFIRCSSTNKWNNILFCGQSPVPRLETKAKEGHLIKEVKKKKKQKTGKHVQKVIYVGGPLLGDSSFEWRLSINLERL